jgi:hypothetical protein
MDVRGATVTQRTSNEKINEYQRIRDARPTLGKLIILSDNHEEQSGTDVVI